MFKRVLNDLAEQTVRVAWSQWAALGAPGSQAERPRSIIDPEALVLISLALRERERRLWDLLGWWAVEGATLLSVQRMKNLAIAYPEPVREAMAEFAELAYARGKDFRWRRLARQEPQSRPRSAKLKQGRVKLESPSTLMLRLRLGLGVGVKADVIACLIGRAGSEVSVRDLARATSYTGRAVRRATEELSQAKLIRSFEEQPAEYALDARAWLRLLGLDGALPAWRFWHQIYSFVTRLLELHSKLEERQATPYVTTSELRKLIEADQELFRWNQIEFPVLDVISGEGYLLIFEHSIKRLISWMEKST